MVILFFYGLDTYIKHVFFETFFQASLSFTLSHALHQVLG